MRCPRLLQLCIRHIPIFTSALFILTVILSYVWAVSLKHVQPVFPFISDTGARAPESCFFGEMLNIGAVLIAVTVYLRYLELRDFVHVGSLPHLRRLSKASLTCGLIAAFGVSIVGNFQEGNQLPLHLVGAFLVFGLGAVYMWIETFITYKIHPVEVSRLICHLRLAFSLVGFLAFISMNVLIAVAYHHYDPKDGRTPIDWRPEDGGWEFHAGSAASEWVVALMEMLFFATYSREFRRFRLVYPRLDFAAIEDLNSSGIIADPGIEDSDNDSFTANSYLI